ncbi:helix-hairpin-helix motif family protein, partial [Chlamydia psittaci 06-1683]
RSRNLHSQLWR